VFDITCVSECLSQGHAFRTEFQRATAGFLELELPSTSKGKVSVYVADFENMIRQRTLACPSFGRLLRDTMLEQPSLSLTVLLYHDIVVPGNVLQPDHQRKSNLLYASFCELGHWLSHVTAWMTVSLVREPLLAEVDDGMSCFMRFFFKALNPLLRRPLTFTVDGQVWPLQISGFALVADEAALKATYCNKGASGIRFCLKCQNVICRTDINAIRAPFVHVSESDPSLFIEMSDSDVFAIVDELARFSAAPHTKVRFRELQLCSGFNFAPQGLLQDKEVRELLPPSKANYDTMHVYFSQGVFGSETQLLFEALDAAFKARRSAVSSLDFVALVSADWITPAPESSLHSTPSERRRAATLAFRDKASASMLLTLFPLLDFFVRTFLQTVESLSREVASYLALCAVIRLTRLAKQSPSQHAGRLPAAQQAHMCLYANAWGWDTARPKHHYQFHLGPQALHWGAMFDCFCTERKHRAFKSIAALCRGEHFERSVLSKLTLHEEELAKTATFENGILDRSLLWKGKRLHRNDCFIFHRPARFAFVVQAFSMDDGTIRIVGEKWEHEAEPADGGSTWWTSAVAAFALPEDFEYATQAYFRDIRGDRLLVLT